jgi:tRNA-intron endonuclease, archaea type
MSSGNNSHNDPTESSQTGESTDLDLSSFPTENSNDMKTSNEENIDSNFMIEAVHHAKEGKVVVPEAKQQDQLRNKGFGEIFNKEYVLNSLESLYLLQNNKIKIYRNKTEYDFSTFLKSLIKKDKKILTKYLIFRDLRSKGYVVKEGFGFGTDFRIYERGEYNKKTSKYVSIGLNEGTNIKASEFAEVIEQVEKMGKSVVIAVVERRGEVIYYKSSKMTFFDNKKSKKSVT